MLAGSDFQVACYDWRMTPFQDVGTDGPHLQRVSGWYPPRKKNWKKNKKKNKKTQNRKLAL